MDDLIFDTPILNETGFRFDDPKEVSRGGGSNPGGVIGAALPNLITVDVSVKSTGISSTSSAVK